MRFASSRNIAALMLACLMARPGLAAPANDNVLPVIVARATVQPRWVPLEAVVEAVRQTTLSAQVAGAITALSVKAGDTVVAGETLLRIDAQAAQAQSEAAAREYERQRQLREKEYISQAALDRAQAEARSRAAQTGFFVVNAPYAGVVSEVPVSPGDMVLPGRALVTIHDPKALRVTVSVPQALLRETKALNLRYALQGLEPRDAPNPQVLPTIDPATSTAQLRFNLPAGTQAVPGQFVRVWLALNDQGLGGDDKRIFVPAKALVRRGELAGVYVLGADGRPRLRQVRPGPASLEQPGWVEILSGVSDGEQVVSDAQQAARLTTQQE